MVSRSEPRWTLPHLRGDQEQEQEYLSDGLTNDIITDLSSFKGLFVIARNASFSYKGQQVKVRQVAEELGVRSWSLVSESWTASRIRSRWAPIGF